MTKRKIHGNIRRLRLASGMTQEQLAKKMKRKQPTIAHWESGLSAPRVDDLSRLADVLLTTIDDLVRGVQ